MKTLLLAGLLCLALSGRAQTLPIDSVSGKVVYRGVVTLPGLSADQVFSKAKRYAQVATQQPLIEQESLVVSGPAESQLGNRILRYAVYIKAQAGGYQYELSDFQNKTLPVQYRNGADELQTTPGGMAPLERVLADADGYRNGKPTPGLVAYKKLVKEAAEQAVADLRAALR